MRNQVVREKVFYRAAYGNRSEIFRLALIFFGGVLCVRGGDFGLPGCCIRIVAGDGKIQRKSKNCRGEKFEKYFAKQRKRLRKAGGSSFEKRCVCVIFRVFIPAVFACSGVLCGFLREKSKKSRKKAAKKRKVFLQTLDSLPPNDL